MLNDLTVIVTIASRRHGNMDEVFAAYDEALRPHVQDLSYVFVVDGGHDAAATALDAIAASNPAVRVIKLNHAFGESTALSIGFDAADSEWLLTLPPYLQIEPASMHKLLDQAGSHDLLSARRWPIRGHLLNRISNKLFNRAVLAMTGLPFRDLGCGVRLLRKTVSTEVPVYGALHRFLPITASQRGFSCVEVSLPQAQQDKELRVHGPSTYIKRLIDLLTVFFLVKFTKRPLRFFGMAGSVSIAAGVAVLALTIFQRLVMSMALADRPLMLLGLVLAVLGVQLFAVGLVGELVIFMHARELKEYTVLKTLNLEQATDDEDRPGRQAG
ncbi:MAG: glycosyltransferase [Gammaproteobacteria bacterium]|nr:glycosyltransferase [Gammaproteobacteria bacterium]NNF60523.1 glycosyltransferase [Gammaproteobacteria bacterium]NNM20295.1 glycosyltransferase [Gammaproteobacteria bacterium]